MKPKFNFMDSLIINVDTFNVDVLVAFGAFGVLHP